MGPGETHTSAIADDHDLLREYAERSAENSFRTLVERHGGMVYGAARRLVGDEHASADITQSVFLALARKSSSLPRSLPLAGWLHTAARYAASHWLRSEARRRQRERAASAGHDDSVNDEPHRQWEEIAPSLDAALASLNRRDREAVLLRFFEQRSFGDVAAGLGTTEDAAKMRVGRAVRKLRVFLQRRGAVVNAVALTTCLAGHAAFTAPAHVAQAAAQAAAQVAGTVAAHGSPIAALTAAIGEAMRWARVKSILLTTSAVVALAAGVWFGIASLQMRPNETAPVAAGDLTAPGTAETLLRDSTVIVGGWRATPGGLVIDEISWGHLAVPGPFEGDYNLRLGFTQQNPAGVVELLLPAGQQMMLILLRHTAAVVTDAATQTLDAALGPQTQSIEHLAEVEVRTRAGEISLSVKFDGELIAETKDVPAAIQHATMVPGQPRGVLGLGASRTGAVFTRVEVQPLQPAGIGTGQHASAAPNSKGLYRLPYADGTQVNVFADFATHTPNGRLDLLAVGGTKPYRVVAAAAGRVVAIQCGFTEQQDGRTVAECHNNYVWIAHPNGEWTNYCHLTHDSVTKKAGLKVGDEVTAGQYLGDEGAVGCAMFDHVHFEVAIPDKEHPLDRGGFLTDNANAKRELNPRFCSVSGENVVKGQTYVAAPCPAPLR